MSRPALFLPDLSRRQAKQRQSAPWSAWDRNASIAQPRPAGHGIEAHGIASRAVRRRSLTCMAPHGQHANAWDRRAQQSRATQSQQCKSSASSTEQSKRMKIVDEPLLDTFRTRGRCEVCGVFCAMREPHHVICKGMGGGRRLDVRENLLAVGSSLPFPECGCHGLVHDGKIKRSALLEILAKRDGYPSGQHLLEELWRMIRVTKKGKLPAEKKPKVKIIFGGTCNKCGAEVECDQSAALRGGVRCKTKEGKVRCFTWIKVSFKRKEEP